MILYIPMFCENVELARGPISATKSERKVFEQHHNLLNLQTTHLHPARTQIITFVLSV